MLSFQLLFWKKGLASWVGLYLWMDFSTLQYSFALPQEYLNYLAYYFNLVRRDWDLIELENIFIYSIDDIMLIPESKDKVKPEGKYSIVIRLCRMCEQTK